MPTLDNTRPSPQATAGRPDTDRVSDGLDALDASPIGRRRIDWASIVAPFVVVAALVFVWQLFVWSGIKPRYVLPAPGDVARSLGSALSDGTALHAVWISLSRGAVGFVISVVLGTALGVLIGQFTLLRKGFRPLLTGLQSMPSVAWVPFALIWFALQPSAIYLVILLGAVPSIANGLIGGLDQIPPIYRSVGQVLGARRLDMVRHVLLPAAMPTYVTGLKQGWAFAWRSLMAAELIANSPDLGVGLGSFMNQAAQNSDMPSVIVAMVLILIVGIVVDQLVFAPIERRVLRNRGLSAPGS